MSDTSDFKDGEFHGKVLGDLESLKLQHAAMNKGQDAIHNRISDLTTSIDSFKTGIGQRVGESEKSIVELKAHQGVMGKIMWIVGTAALTALVAAMLRLVIK